MSDAGSPGSQDGSAAVPWTATVLTLYPDMFPGPLGAAVTGNALRRGLWALESVDIRGFARDKHHSVDDTPAGGGPGMVMRADVLGRAVDDALARAPLERPLLYMSPRGAPMTQSMVRRWAAAPGLVILCGRFEGVDERLLEARAVEEVSLGDFVLSGGEIAAMAVIDAATRLLPGVLGAEASRDEESFEAGLLEYPHYTRPQEWEGRTIPEVLLSGHHGKIAAWRKSEAERITRDRRPDLWAAYQKIRDGSAE